jgi:Mrp family chromosome partitioning ATPase
MDQAFVKAFARRNRSGQDQAGQASRGNNQQPRSESETAPLPGSTVEPGSLQVDRSVASTAKVWVDPIEDQIARADIADLDVPKPHVDPQVEHPAPPPPKVQSADLLQHIHTAYASALADVPVLPAESLSVVETMNVAPATAVPVAPPVDVAQAPVVVSAPIQGPTIQPAPEPVQPAPEQPAPEQPAPEQPAPEQPAPHEVTELRVDPPVEYKAAVEYKKAPVSLTSLQAVWEVDVFDVPTSVADLFFEGTLFQQIAERMSDAVSAGLNSVLVTSAKQGEGRSTVAIGMAMASAAAGIRVALVDADTEDPTLADDLRLDLQYGWVDTVRGGLPIKEVAVHAVEDGVTLIPLMPPHGRTAATAFEVIQLIDMLKDKFELVIIDGPTGRSSNIHQCASAVDSAIIVRDMTRTDTLAINEFSYRLRESGVHGVGVVENYV